MDEERLRPLLLRAVMAEPDGPVASAVVVGMLERLGAEERSGWVEALKPGDGAFSVRRAEELSVLEAVRSGDFPEDRIHDEVDAWSDWLQRHVTEGGASAAVLEALAEHARTRRIRHLAREAVRRLPS
jgi:hypothetical protein